VEDLTHRVKREKAAYDAGSVWRHNDQLHRRFAHVFFCANTVRAEAFFQQAMAEAAHLGAVLDYGCFEGALCEELIRHHPQRIVGIDVSSTALARARESYGAHATFFQMDAHRLAFEDKTFDLVVGRAILHHLELATALAEIRRTLKPGGKALFIEPLRDNPVARLLRLVTPKARTRDELPLSRRQIRRADALFGSSQHLFFNLFSVPAGMVSTGVCSMADNPLTRMADRLDLILARTPLRYWMRSVVLVWRRGG